MVDRKTRGFLPSEIAFAAMLTVADIEGNRGMHTMVETEIMATPGVSMTIVNECLLAVQGELKEARMNDDQKAEEPQEEQWMSAEETSDGSCSVDPMGDEGEMMVQ
ncbi:MAG: hypothetical protein P4M11_13095 [Candidatus Pacebacteria bacterium]|nr:hypothetical protein [Candidatus Paceibacterota bacterium]